MKLTLTPTAQIVTLHDSGLFGATVQARIWEGADDQGTPLHVYIVRVAVHEDEPPEVHERFARELQECPKPMPGIPIPSDLIV